MTRKRTFGLNPIERAVLVAAWKQQAVSGRIHALIGDDSDKLVNGAGRIFYVVLGACADAQVAIGAEDPDVRILRGSVNALGEQAGEPEISQQRRGAIVSGLQACDRLVPKLTQRALADAALDLQVRLAVGEVKFRDFEQLVRMVA